MRYKIFLSIFVAFGASFLGAMMIGASTQSVAPAATTPPVATTPLVVEKNDQSVTLAWADVIEQNPDPKVVTNADFLQRITESKLPWRVRDKTTGIEMLLVPPGKFLMGMSAGDAEARYNEKPSHEVTLTKPFYLGRTEVTQLQWTKVMKVNPSKFNQTTDHAAIIKKLMSEGVSQKDAEAKAALMPTTNEMYPVEELSWNLCQEFCAKTGLSLPTESQWEYACRGGSTSARYGSVDDISWNARNTDGHTHPVAMKAPNSLGFYDMLGNVWEWTQDWHATYSADNEVDPTGVKEGTQRVLRGGGFVIGPVACRVSYRAYGNPDGSGIGRGGFRVARAP